MLESTIIKVSSFSRSVSFSIIGSLKSPIIEVKGKVSNYDSDNSINNSIENLEKPKLSSNAQKHLKISGKPYYKKSSYN